jgi:hypothetical protein
VLPENNRFPVVESPLPLPLQAVYRDFATSDPVIDVAPMAMNVLAVGPENTATGLAGRTNDLTRSVAVTLTQGNVYGALLVDTVFVPSRSDIEL